MTLPAGSPLPPLATTRDVVAFLGEAIHWVVRGEIDAKIGNTAAYMAGVMLRGLASVEVLARLERLESAVASLPEAEAESAAAELGNVRRLADRIGGDA